MDSDVGSSSVAYKVEVAVTGGDCARRWSLHVSSSLVDGLVADREGGPDGLVEACRRGPPLAQRRQGSDGDLQLRSGLGQKLSETRLALFFRVVTVHLRQDVAREQVAVLGQDAHVLRPLPPYKVENIDRRRFKKLT